MKNFLIISLSLFLSLHLYSQNDSLDLTKLSLEDLMNLKISSVSKKSESVLKAPQTVIVITAKELEERGYTDLEQLFHDLPGFDISRGYGTQYSQIYQRGYRSNNTERTAFMIDGVEENDLWSLSVWLSRQYPISNIKRIEIIYGPASTVYGANAFLGVVNIITKDGEKLIKSFKNFSVNANIGYGSWNTRYTDVNLQYMPTKDIAFSLTGRYYYSDEVDMSKYPDFDYDLSVYDLDYYKNKLGTTSDAIAQRAMDLDNQYYYNDTVLHGVKPQYSNTTNDYLINAKLKLYDFTIGYQTFRRDEGYGAWYRDDYELGPKHDGRWVANNSFLYAKYDKKLTKNLRITSFSRFKIHTIDGDSKELYFYGYMNGGYGLNNIADSTGNLLPDSLQSKPYFWQGFFHTYSQQLRSELRTVYRKDNFNLVSGVEVRFSHSQGDYWVSTRPHPEDYGTPYSGVQPGGNYFYSRDIGAFAQADYSLKNFKFVLGGRLDNNRIRKTGGYGTAFNPKVAVIYSPSNFVFKLIYSEAFMDASYWTKYGTTPGRLLNNPNLSPEKVKNLEFGWSWPLTNNLLFQSSTYFSHYDGTVGTAKVSYVDENGNTVETTQHQAVGSLEIYGAQANLTYRYKNYSVYLNYSYTNPYDITEGKVRIGDIASHKANIGANALLFNKLNINIRANYVGEKPTGASTTISSNPYDKIEPYFIVNGAIRYNLYKNISIQATINNILNKEYYDPGVRSANGVYYAARIPQYGRNFMVKLIFKN